MILWLGTCARTASNLSVWVNTLIGATVVAAYETTVLLVEGYIPTPDTLACIMDGISGYFAQ